MSPDRLRSFAFAAAIGLVALAFVVPLCLRVIILSDEGYLLLQSLDMLSGKVLYRDMDAFVAPGAWFLLAGVFSIFEPSILSSRIPVVLGYLALVWVTYSIVARVATRVYALAALALLAIATVWAFPVWTFAFYSHFSVLFALVALERLLAWDAQGRTRDLVWVGVAIGLSILFKQNYGAFALMGSMMGFAALRIGAGGSVAATLRALVAHGVPVAAGVAAIGLPTLAYFAYHGAIPDVWQSLVVHPFEFGGRQDVPYLGFPMFWQQDILGGLSRLTYGTYALNHHPAPFASLPRSIQLVERLHIGLYWLPVFVFGLAAWLSLRPGAGRRIDGVLLCVSGVCGWIFLGVFPRADFNHLINVYQPVIVTAAIVAHRTAMRLPTSRPWLARAGILLVWGIVCLYASVAIYWYEAMVRKADTLLLQRRGGVYVSEPDARMINAQVTTILRQTQPGEAVLTIPDLAMLNWLAERPMPSRYYNLYEHHITHDDGAEVVAAAEAAGVRLVVTRYENFFSDRVGLLDYAGVLTDYLKTHFKTWFVVGNDEYIYFVRRDAPAPPVERIDFLEGCDLEGARPDRFVNYHLLFSTLYHYPGTGVQAPTRRMETRCPIRVPDDGVLVLRVGYRRPGAATRDARLDAQIEIEGPSGREMLLERVFPVGIKDRWGRPDHPEFRLDLGDWAGEDVTLVFRTLRQGRVQVHFLDFKGFAMVFEDPHIERKPAP